MDDDAIDSSNECIVTAINIMSKDTEIHREKNLLSATNVGSELDITSHIGMEFESIEKIREFYTAFAKKRGFGICVHSSKTKSTMFVCCNEGQHKVKGSKNEEVEDNKSQTKKNCSTFRSGYQASLMVSKGTTKSNWVIKSFNTNHNHVMVSPKSVSYVRCHKKMSIAAKPLLKNMKKRAYLLERLLQF